MPLEPRTVVTENKDLGLRIVSRELFGRDRATLSFIEAVIVNALSARLGLKPSDGIENAILWEIARVAQIIVQTISLEEIEGSEGVWPDGLVLPSTSNHIACVAFYDCLMDHPNRYMNFLLEGVKAANTSVPNPTGGKGVKPSQPALVPASSKTLAG